MHQNERFQDRIFKNFLGRGSPSPLPRPLPPFFLGLRPRFGLRPQNSGASRPRLSTKNLSKFMKLCCPPPMGKSGSAPGCIRMEGGGHSLMASSKSSVFRFFLKLESELLSLQWLPRLIQTDGSAQLNPRAHATGRSNEWFLEEAPVAGSELTISPRNMVLEKFVQVPGPASDIVRDHCDFEPESLFDRKPMQLDECWLGIVGRYSHYSSEFVLI